MSIKNKDFNITELSDFYYWVVANAVAISSNKSDVIKNITETIIATKDPIRKASILVLAKPEVVKNLKSFNQHRNEIRNYLIETLKDPKLSEKQQKLIKTAIQG